MPTGMMMIADERARQIRVEGFDAFHDDDFETDEYHQGGELALAACYYALPGTLHCHVRAEVDGKEIAKEVCIELEPFVLWPDNWDGQTAKRKGKGRIRQLVVAGALIAAEIDRLQRKEEQDGCRLN